VAGAPITSGDHSPACGRATQLSCRYFEAGDKISAQDLTSRVVHRAQCDLDQTLLPELDGVAVTRLLLHGEPAVEIANTAFNKNVDLIMLATRGFGAFHRFLVGSVTAKVLHESDCRSGQALIWKIAP